MIKKTFIHLCCYAALVAVTACTSQEETGTETFSKFGIINVGSLTMGDNIATAVTRTGEDTEGTEANNIYKAEDISWLQKVLSKGLQITYSNIFDQETGNITKDKARTAILKFEELEGYSFKYDSGEQVGQNAEWMGNGIHIFEGKYIPAKLQNDIPADLIENQSVENDDDEESNYNLLSHYTCMVPYPQSKIAATINRISLPFQHRLARVIVQVVIDDDIKEDYTNPASKRAAIKGYDSSKKNGGGKDCTLRFCNVQVLKKVDENGTPIWTDNNIENKIVPHFIEEKKTATETVYAADSTKTINTYYNVPTFDLIVRPTYFDRAAPMTDEPDADVNDKNHIFFSVALNNGMIYEKTVEFDLNPNEQTTITLHITREGVNVNDAGTNNWIETKSNDGYYGIDNTIGHNLSDAGSCWQRAYQISTDKTDKYEVTDGSNPATPDNDINKNTQYLTQEQFIDALKEAREGGKHHGDYFILTKDLTLDSWEPFTFTGHLDGRHNHIKIPAGKDALFTELNGNYTAEVGTANINSDNSPMPGYRAEIMNLYLTNVDKDLVSGQNTGYIYNCHITGNGKFCEENADTNTTGKVVDCTKKPRL